MERESERERERAHTCIHHRAAPEIHRQQQTYPKNTRGPGQSARTSEIHYPANKLLLFKICINVRAKYAEGLRWCCCLRVSALSVYTCACVCVFVKLSRSARNAGAYCCRQQKAWLPRSTINRRAIIEMSVDSRKSPATEYSVDILLLLLLGHASPFEASPAAQNHFGCTCNIIGIQIARRFVDGFAEPVAICPPAAAAAALRPCYARPDAHATRVLCAQKSRAHVEQRPRCNLSDTADWTHDAADGIA